MRCAACGKRLESPAWVGSAGYWLGPVCARKAGKIKPKARRAAQEVAEVQDGQIELFEESEK